MTSNKEISSVSSGVNEAIEVYLKAKKKIRYEKLMEEAVHDPKFLMRLKDVESDYEGSNQEVPGKW